MPVTAGLALIGGAVAGSAAGAAIHRWPAGTTLLAPRRSSCDGCGVRLQVRDLVPVLSWVMLRGRCRACGVRIDARVPLLEVVSPLVAVTILHVHGPTITAVVLAIGAVGVLVAAFIDAEHLIVPDRLTRPLALLALVATPIVTGADRAGGVALWALGVPSVLLLLAIAADRMGRARPVGGGDIKLLVGVLALAGVAPSGPPAVLLAAVVLAGSVAVLGLVTGRVTRRSRLPFAPPLAVAFLIVVLAPDRAGDIVSIVGGHSWSV